MSIVTQLSQPSQPNQKSQKSFRSQIAKLDFVHEQRVKLCKKLVQTGHLDPDLCRLISMYVGVVFQIYKYERHNGIIWKCSAYIAGNPGQTKIYMIPPVPSIPSIPDSQYGDQYLINGGDCYYNCSFLEYVIGNIHRQITDVHVNSISFGNGMELISWSYANKFINTSSSHVLMQNGKQVPLVSLPQIPDEITNEITKHGVVQIQILPAPIYVETHPLFSVRSIAAKFNIGIVHRVEIATAYGELHIWRIIAIQLPDTPDPSVTVQTTRVV